LPSAAAIEECKPHTPATSKERPVAAIVDRVIVASNRYSLFAASCRME
jgi:hypothetical protein